MQTYHCAQERVAYLGVCAALRCDADSKVDEASRLEEKAATFFSSLAVDFMWWAVESVIGWSVGGSTSKIWSSKHPRHALTRLATDQPLAQGSLRYRLILSFSLSCPVKSPQTHKNSESPHPGAHLHHSSVPHCSTSSSQYLNKGSSHQLRHHRQIPYVGFHSSRRNRFKAKKGIPSRKTHGSNTVSSSLFIKYPCRIDQVAPLTRRSSRLAYKHPPLIPSQQSPCQITSLEVRAIYSRSKQLSFVHTTHPLLPHSHSTSE